MTGTHRRCPDDPLSDGHAQIRRAPDIAAVLDTIASIVCDSIAAVVAIAAHVVVGFDRLMVSQALEVRADDPLQLRAACAPACWR